MAKVTKRHADARPSIILANLTDAEFDRFHAARIGYSGATPKGAPSSGTYNWGASAPYIATFFDVLPAALKAIGWTRIKVRCRDHQWIVKRRGNR
jgi:hypothetical protein